ncbi:MAG: gliding motility-associated C-terminal domain-containing protein, partial [Saprospiraceae bacterium]
SLCPGEIASLYTPEIDPDDVYNWMIPSGVSIISGSGTNEIEIQGSISGEVEICLEVTNVCGTTENCTFLTLLADHASNFDTVLCLGTTIIINGHAYGNGVWTGIEHFTGMNGCDSIVQINITEATSLEFMYTKYLCPGDSIFLQGAFQTQAGSYIDSFTTISNCDSLVITEVIVSPFDTTWIVSTTCDPASAGTTITSYSQGNCDSTVITTVLLLVSDTTTISLFSCMTSDTGQTLQMLTNQAGCDSLVITNTFLLQSDTTLLFLTSCDPAMTGVMMQTLSNNNGCDSLVITTTSFLLSDTTLINVLTCTYADTGETFTLYVNAMGCDSLVISTTNYAGSDTTFITGTTCNPANSGLIISHLTNLNGCDSVISIFVSLLQSDTTYLTTTSCEPLDTGVVIQSLTNSFGCDSMVITTTTLVPVDLCQFQAFVSVVQPLCYGDSAKVILELQTGLGPFDIHLMHMGSMLSYEYPSAGIYSFSIGVAGESYIVLTSANGLQIVDTIYVDALSSFEIDAQNVSDYNGYGIACHGDSTGEAKVNILSGGASPFLFEWSNGMNADDVANLKAGLYGVTVTDIHGCATSTSIVITEPMEIQYSITIDDILCFGDMSGGVSLSALQGGVLPVITSLDNNSFQSVLSYQTLLPGNHDLVIKDQNGCASEQQFELSDPSDWSIDLGSDTTVNYGAQFEIKPFVYGLPNGKVNYTWSDNQCDSCGSRIFEIKTTSLFSITATDENGCTSVDEIRISVSVNRDLFIPNIFSPDGDQVNDLFMISSGQGIKEIEELTIYDRWGSLVFQKFHFQSNDPPTAWNGVLNGKPLNMGVYTYKLVVVFEDNLHETRFGDVTLIR